MSPSVPSAPSSRFRGGPPSPLCLAIFEISIWLTVVSTVINQIKDQPLLVVFYAFGYATGNVVGIMVERKLAFGTMILRIITRTAGPEIAAHLREKGQPVTIFHGEGMRGPVNELYIACRRRELKWILPEVQRLDPRLFYVIEQARDMSKVLKPVSHCTWRLAGHRQAQIARSSAAKG